MSENTDQTSLQEINSVAGRLKAAGFHKTSITRAVTELVGEYLGIHTNMGKNLVEALGRTNAGALDALGPKEIVEPIKHIPSGLSGNDAAFETKKSA